MVPYSMQHFILTGHARYVAIILLQSSITTNIVTFSQCILLCSLEINNRHHSLDMNSIPPKSFPPGRTYSVTIVVVITIMHKLTPRVMLWLTCTNILWQYVVTNIVVVVDVVCYCCRRYVIAFKTDICYLTFSSRRHYPNQQSPQLAIGSGLLHL